MMKTLFDTLFHEGVNMNKLCIVLNILRFLSLKKQ